MKRSKGGKAPTVEQKKVLARNGLYWPEWLVVGNFPNSITVRHRVTGEFKTLERGG